MITNISIHHDHIKFLHESHIGYNLLVFMIQHMSSSWSYFQDICRILLFNYSLKILIHHGSNHKPKHENVWDPQWTPHRSHLVHHMEFILIVSYLIQSLSSSLMHAQQYVYDIHLEFIRAPSCIFMEQAYFNSSNILHVLQIEHSFKCITQCKH